MQLSVPRVFSIAQTPTKSHRIGLGREGERGKQSVLRQKTESQKWERVINTLLIEMGTKYWILNCPILISNTEKQRLKIQSRGQTLKNTVLKTKTKTHTQKNFRNIYEVWFKNRASFFVQGYSEMKMKIKEQQRSNRGI